MPGFDGTGPLGTGPMTGRGLGPCGSGFSRGWGRGRRACSAWLWRRFRPNDPRERREILVGEAKALKEELQDIEEELKKLK